MKNSRLRAYAELMRLPNVFTAMADILAGYFITSMETDTLPGLVFLLVASSGLYTSGIVLNDYFDYIIDKAERPERPLPSGRVRRETALVLGLSLLGIGCLSAAAAGRASAVVALLLAASILSYDGLTKNIPVLGSVNMGVCRYWNFVLGMSLSELDPLTLTVPLLLMLYVVAITTLSKGEVGGGRRRPVLRSLMLLTAVVIGFVLLNRSAVLPNEISLLALALFCVMILRFVVTALTRPETSNIRRAVKFLVLGLIPLDATIVIGATDVLHGVIVLALLLPSLLLARYLYVT
jgi:4-hydroxybenzoate polyprenyltransferase